MRISGFTFVKNATKLYFPVRESIESILPVVDEYIVLLDESDPEDLTRQAIESINSPKIKIINSTWDKSKYPHNTIYAYETDKAKENCTGDWLFYLQSDEVVHEKYLERIVEACARFKDDEDVEGLLFEFRHFWGDFSHYFKAHNWYPREIRIIRNSDDIHSWKDAQSFRVFDEFNYTFEDYLRKKGTRKLNVARIYAAIYHYGWVRPPDVMTNKTKIADPKLAGQLNDSFDYGPLDRLAVFTGTHPKVLYPWIKRVFNWEDKLQKRGIRNPSRKKYKHEKLKYRFLSFIEYTFLGGNQIGGFKNYRIIRNYKPEEI